MSAVQFILGRAGTGKTRHCLDRIRALVAADPIAGPPVYWLVPKQATFQNQRLLAAELGGFSRVRVVSFDTLGADILAACGAVDVPEVTPTGRRLVIGHLLRTRVPDLKFYAPSAHQPGLAKEVDAAFAELERAGVDAEKLDELLHTFDAADPAYDAVRDKLADVHLLMAAYDRYLGDHRLDPGRRLQRILKQVDRCPTLAAATLLVDDFYDFTTPERQLLAAVAAAVAETDVCLLLDPDDPAVAGPQRTAGDLSIFHRTARTYAALHRSFAKSGVRVEPPLLLRDCKRYQGDTLCHVERHLFEPDPPPVEQPAGVELFDAPDARAEVDAVARRIGDAVRTGGLRYRDVAVLVRTLAEGRERVHASFAEHGIPYFADHRRSAAHHPLLETVRASLRIALNGWPTEAVLALVKGGLTALSDDDAAALENYVDRHRIRGRQWQSPDPWAFRRVPPGADPATVSALEAEAKRVDDLRSGIVAALDPLLTVGDSPVTIRDLATRVFAVLENFGVRGTLAKWMAAAATKGDLEARGEHEQVWAELVALFESMVDLLGDERMPLAEFVRVLEDGLDGFDHAIPPPTVDQVLLGGVDRTRTPAVKLTFVLGLNEGEFPAAGRDDCVLTDGDRRLLRQREVDLEPDADRLLLDERFLAYVALTRASERLVVSRPVTTAAGKPANPSPFWTELRRLLPTVDVHHVPRPSRSDPATIGTPRQLVNALMRWVRSPPAPSPGTPGEGWGEGELEGQTASAPKDPRTPALSRRTGRGGQSPWPALYQWLVTDPSVSPAVLAVRDRAWAALAYDNSAALPLAVAERLFPLPLHATVAELETMAACPFRHFAKYGLALRGKEDARVTLLDLNRAYHDVLERLVGDLLADRQDWCSLEPDVLRERIRAHTADVGRRLKGELMLSSARNRYLLDRIERTLTQTVAAMTEAGRRGSYRPRVAGLKFGDPGGADGEATTLPPHVVRTPGGSAVHLSGRIDRVDVNSRVSAFTVADYKLGGGRLPLDRVYHGLSLQLLTYLLVVQAGGKHLTGKPLAPAAAFLLQLLRSPGTVDHPDDAMSPDHPDFDLRIKPRGLIDDRALPSLDAGLTDGMSAVVSAYRKKTDGTFGFKASTDVADAAEFAALLAHVERRLGELADRAAAGVVTVEPYLLGGETPCSRCEYRSVCRFEPGINRYRVIPPMRRDAVLALLTGEGDPSPPRRGDAEKTNAS